MCLCIYLASRCMIFQSHWTSFERRKRPSPCLCSLLKMLVNIHTLACLFLILPAEMKNKSGTKVRLRAFCFSHPNLLLYFFTHRICGISPCERQLSSSVPSAISALPAEKPRRSAEQWLSSNLNIHIWLFKQQKILQNHVWDKNDIKLSIIKSLFSCTPEMSSS